MDSECFVSIASAWEIVVRPKLGRSSEEVEAKVVEIGAKMLPMQFSQLKELTKLPYFQDHRDPFDRLLIAQAIAEDLTMVSSDTRFAQYGELTLFWE